MQEVLSCKLCTLGCVSGRVGVVPGRRNTVFTLPLQYTWEVSISTHIFALCLSVLPDLSLKPSQVSEVLFLHTCSLSRFSFSHRGNFSVTKRGHYIALVSQAGKFALGYNSHRLSMTCNPSDFLNFCLLSWAKESTSFLWEIIGRVERRSWLQSKRWWDIFAQFIR